MNGLDDAEVEEDRIYKTIIETSREDESIKAKDFSEHNSDSKMEMEEIASEQSHQEEVEIEPDNKSIENI